MSTEPVADITRTPVVVPEPVKEPHPTVVYVKRYLAAAWRAFRVPAIILGTSLSGVSLLFFLLGFVVSVPFSFSAMVGLGIGSVPVCVFLAWVFHQSVLDEMDLKRKRYY